MAYFSEQAPIRRAKGGDDLFSQLCRATHEDGALLSNQDIVDHMSFLMMAAHDTLTSSLTSFVAALAANTQWQNRLRDEVTALGVAADEPTTFDNLESMSLTEMAFREAMQIRPPVPSFRGAPHVTSASAAIRFPQARWSGSIRCLPTTCARYGPIPTPSIRCNSPTRRSAPGIASPGCRSAAARICALACTSPTCRRSASRAIFFQNLEVSLTPGATPDWQMWPIPKPARRTSRDVDAAGVISPIRTPRFNA